MNSSLCRLKWGNIAGLLPYSKEEFTLTAPYIYIRDTSAKQLQSIFLLFSGQHKLQQIWFSLTICLREMLLLILPTLTFMAMLELFRPTLLKNNLWSSIKVWSYYEHIVIQIVWLEDLTLLNEVINDKIKYINMALNLQTCKAMELPWCFSECRYFLKPGSLSAIELMGRFF